MQELYGESSKHLTLPPITHNQQVCGVVGLIHLFRKWTGSFARIESQLAGTHVEIQGNSIIKIIELVGVTETVH